RMTQLVSLAGDSANAASLADYKTEFDSLRTKISGAISGATYGYDGGTAGANFTSQNLLDGTLSSPITVQYNAAGDATSVRTFDLSASSSFQTQLDTANAAFQALT